jgi:hypothetical protein
MWAGSRDTILRRSSNLLKIRDPIPLVAFHKRGVYLIAHRGKGNHDLPRPIGGMRHLIRKNATTFFIDTLNPPLQVISKFHARSVAGNGLFV